MNLPPVVARAARMKPGDGLVVEIQCDEEGLFVDLTPVGGPVLSGDDVRMFLVLLSARLEVVL